MDNIILRAMLSKEDPGETISPEPDPTPLQEPVVLTTSIDTAATNVMYAYQTANKWLDSIKESLLMDHGCVFFSNYIHNLAHTMPARFDKFGDILHTGDLKVPYPETPRYSIETSSISIVFEEVFNILDNIKKSLCEFIKATEGTPMHGMACAAESLLNDIESEYPALYRMRRTWNVCGDIIKFDKWIAQYMNNSSSLID